MERFRSSGTPELHRSRNLKALRQHPKWASVFDASLKIVRTGGIVGLCGDRGTGKTQIATECVRAFAADGKDGIYLRAQEVFDLTRDAYNKKVSEKQAIGRLLRTKLLVIDECHERGNSEFEQRILALILDIRYSAAMPTIMLTNLSPADFRDSIGPSISSRIDETGTVFFCDWPSFRRTGSWQNAQP